MTEDRDWRASANCRDVDPETMQPEVATPAEVAAAKRVCRGCPVRDQCLDLARTYAPGTYGVHAGKWWGPDPTNPATNPCGWCGEPTPGPHATYCGQAHQKAAYRARQAAAAS